MGGYEIHQKLRTKAVRQLKKKDYDGAIESLYAGAKELLNGVDGKKEQGSGCDLAIYMVDVYKQADVPSDSRSRARVVELIGLADPDFWRKKLIDAALKWSSGITGLPLADGHLRLAIAELLQKQGSYHAAEWHYVAACCPPPPGSSAHLAATRDKGLVIAELYPGEAASKAFAEATLQWLQAFGDDEEKKGGRKSDVVQRAEAGRFALRGLMPLLASRALTGSRQYLAALMEKLVAKHPSLLLPVQPNPKSFTPPPGSLPASLQSSASSLDCASQSLYLTGNADVNFAQMVLGLCTLAVDIKKRGGAGPNGRINDQLKSAFVGLVRQYEREGAGRGAGASSATAEELDEVVGECVPLLSSAYFDMQPPRQQGNFMQDMLGALMGGGPAGGAAGGGGASSGTPLPQLRQAPAPRPFEGEEKGAGAEAGEGEADGKEGEDEELDLD